MKYMILGIIAFLLVGCGEKFDASTNKMAKISYNNILKEIEDEAKRGDFEMSNFQSNPMGMAKKLPPV